MKPAWAVLVDDDSEHAGCVEVGNRDEHRRYPVSEAAAGAKLVEQDVGGHPAAKKACQVDASDPDEPEHDVSPIHVTVVRQYVWRYPGGQPRREGYMVRGFRLWFQITPNRFRTEPLAQVLATGLQLQHLES